MPTNRFRVSFDVELTDENDDNGDLVSNADLVNQIDLSDSALTTFVRNAIENKVYGIHINVPNTDGTFLVLDFMIENLKVVTQ